MQSIGTSVPRRAGNYGFTLMELMVVMAVIVVLSSVAVPNALQWINNAAYRNTARIILNIMREARSRTIESNLEHRVEIESSGGRYRLTRGNRSNDSYDWNTVIYDWTAFPPNVRIDSNRDSIQFNANGTSTNGTISVQDDTCTTRYEIKVARTGRMRIEAL